MKFSFPKSLSFGIVLLWCPKTRREWPLSTQRTSIQFHHFMYALVFFFNFISPRLYHDYYQNNKKKGTLYHAQLKNLSRKKTKTTRRRWKLLRYKFCEQTQMLINVVEVAGQMVSSRYSKKKKKKKSQGREETFKCVGGGRTCYAILRVSSLRLIFGPIFP